MQKIRLAQIIVGIFFLFSSSLLSAQTLVSGTISSDSTWTLAGSPYSLTGPVTVDAGITLTIEAGVEVAFGNSGWDLIVNGALSAIGGPGADSIRFSGSGASVQAGAGGEISVDYGVFTQMGISNIAALVTAGAGTISNSRFDDNETGISVASGASPTILNCEITNSNDYGIDVIDGSPSITNVSIDQAVLGGIWIRNGSPAITLSSISNAGINGGIWINTTDIPTIDNNTFSNNSRDIRANPMVLDDAVFANNGLNVVHVEGTSITSTTTWQQPQSPEAWTYELTGPVTVDAGITLTIEAGVEVAFGNSGWDLIVNGALSAIGGPGADSIRFSGSGASVQAGAGGEISVDYGVFTQMGISNIAALVTAGAGTISNSRFDDNETGISVASGASPTILNCEITNSNDYGIDVIDGSPSITNVSIDQAVLGGIWIRNGSPAITLSSISNAGINGGIWINTTDIPTIDNNTFSNNSRDIRANPMVLDDAVFANNGLNVVHVEGTSITSTTTWQQPQSPEAWTYELTGPVTVDAGITLTIEAGVEVAFGNSGWDLIVNGALSAIGGPGADSIRFSGSGASVQAGAGGEISVDYGVFTQMGISNIAALVTAGAGTISNSRFDDNETGISVASGASPTILNCEITNSNDYGIDVIDGSPSITNVSIDQAVLGGIWIRNGSPAITLSSISNAGINGGIWINTTDIPTIDNNTFSNNSRDIRANPMVLDDAVFANNGLNVVHVEGTSITSTTTWQQPQSPEAWTYELTGPVTVDAGITLTIEAGVEVAFGNSGWDLIVNGALSAIGGPGADSIRFSGSGASVQAGAGGEISVDYGVFTQMGISNIAALVTAGAGTISNSRFDDNETGISVASGASPTILNCEITNSNDYGIDVIDGSPSITNVSIDQAVLGGIWIRNGSPAITLSSISNAGINGGIWIDGTSSAVIDGNVIDNTSIAINIDFISIPTLTGNTILNASKPVRVPAELVDKISWAGNGITEVYLNSSFTIQQNVTFQSESWKYILEGDLVVDPLATLTLAPGYTLEFQNVTYDLRVNGTLNAVGTSTDSVFFIGTNASASSHGGQVQLTNQSTGSQLSFVSFKKMGDSNSAGDASLVVSSSDATIGNLKIFDSETSGIRLTDDAAPTFIAGSIEMDGTTNGVYVNSGSPVIDGFSMMNQINGIYVFSGDPVLQNNQISNSTTNGIWIDGTSSAILDGNVVDGASVGINIDFITIPTLTGNSILNTSKQVRAPAELVDKINWNGNGITDIYLASSFPINQNVTFQTEPWTYRLEGDLVVNSGSTLTLVPGYTLEFPNVTYDLRVNGTINAVGNSTDSVFFVGTNPVGSSHGGQVQVTDQSVGSQFNYVSFKKWAIQTALVTLASFLSTNDVTVSNVRIFDSESSGIRITNVLFPR